MRTILVTGVTGFIGYHLTKKIINNYKIIGIDNLNNYYDIKLKKARLKKLEHRNFTFIECDICDNERLDKIFDKYKIDKVINLAAQVGVRNSIDNPDQYIKTNILGFYNILENVRKHKIEHLIYASSSSVYGNNIIPFRENEKTDSPISLYAATKKSDELLAYSYSKLYNINCTGLRFFTVYGPCGRPDMAYFNFTKKILNNETIKLFNYGQCTRDFTYIDDVIDIIEKIMEKPITKIYNIGSSNPIKILDFINILKEELIKEKLISKEYELKIELLHPQPGDVDATYADISELKKDFDYMPNTKLKEGLNKFIKWYKEYYMEKR